MNGMTHGHNHTVDAANAQFSTDPAGLPAATAPQTVELRDGDVFALRASAVAKRIGGIDLRMLAYNGSIPGPTLHVVQGSEITVEVLNDIDVDTTVHWHGLRLENRYDGAPHETQPPISVGGTFSYTLQFPDAGIYWYHPHIREDYAMEMGLYGAIVVEPALPSYWPAVDRHLTLTLDDLLVEGDHVAPFLRSGPTYTAMGRFGRGIVKKKPKTAPGLKCSYVEGSTSGRHCFWSNLATEYSV